MPSRAYFVTLCENIFRYFCAPLYIRRADGRGRELPTEQVPRSHSKVHLAPSRPAGVATGEMRVPIRQGSYTSLLRFSAPQA